MASTKLSLKNAALLLGLLIGFSSLLWYISRNDSKQVGKVVPVEKISFSGALKINKDSSEVTWLGKKTGGEHMGTIQILNGELRANAGMLTYARITMDMNSIVCTDIEEVEDNLDLINHLKDKDFFATYEFPAAQFDLVEARKEPDGHWYTLKGKLSIRGIVLDYSFPCEVWYENDRLKVEGTMKIDRTKFGITYKSKSFFSDLGDRFLHDEFEIGISLRAYP